MTDEEFLSCLKEHRVAIALNVKLNHVDVCMHPDEHGPSWHVIRVPFDESQEILTCPVCAGIRKEASHNPSYREIYSNIDLSQ